MKRKILIIDNGSKFSSWLEVELQLQKIPFKVISPTQKINLKRLKNISGIILTGGPKKPSTRNLTNDYKALEEFSVPILGICLGHQTIATHFGAIIIILKKNQNKVEKIKITKQLESFALRCSKAIRADVCAIDYCMIGRDPSVIEVNQSPDFSRHTIFGPKINAAKKIVELAVKKSRR